MQTGTYTITIEVTDRMTDIVDLVSSAASHIESGNVTSGSLSDEGVTVSWKKGAAKVAPPVDNTLAYIVGQLACEVGINVPGRALLNNDHTVFMSGYSYQYEQQAKITKLTEELF